MLLRAASRRPISAGPSPLLVAARIAPGRTFCASVSIAKASLIRDLLTNKTKLFKRLDADGSGKVDAGELQAALQEAGAHDVSIEQAAALIKQADKNGNGEIDIDELTGVLTQGTLFQGVIKR